MASRPVIPPYQVITDGDMSGNITSEVTVITNISMVSYAVSWSGSSPVGTFSVEVSNDYEKNAAGGVANAGTWTALTLSASPSVSGNTGNGFIDLGRISAYAVRLKYTRTSGSGTLQATVAGKVH